MLEITVPLTREGWDEVKQEFVEPKVQILKLEHSLVSLSKWESKWCKPFLSTAEKTAEETLDYIKFMTLTQNVKPEVYDHLTVDNIRRINEYISAPMTATTIKKDKKSKKNDRVITSELIYYWMFSFGINMECQKWHLNRLLMLIRVFDEESKPKQERSQDDIRADYAALNAARRKALNSKG